MRCLYTRLWYVWCRLCQLHSPKPSSLVFAMRNHFLEAHRLSCHEEYKCKPFSTRIRSVQYFICEIFGKMCCAKLRFCTETPFEGHKYSCRKQTETPVFDFYVHIACIFYWLLPTGLSRVNVSIIIIIIIIIIIKHS